MSDRYAPMISETYLVRPRPVSPRDVLGEDFEPTSCSTPAPAIVQVASQQAVAASVGKRKSASAARASGPKKPKGPDVDEVLTDRLAALIAQKAPKEFNRTWHVELARQFRQNLSNRDLAAVARSWGWKASAFNAGGYSRTLPAEAAKLCERDLVLLMFHMVFAIGPYTRKPVLKLFGIDEQQIREQILEERKQAQRVRGRRRRPRRKPKPRRALSRARSTRSTPRSTAAPPSRKPRNPSRRRPRRRRRARRNDRPRERRQRHLRRLRLHRRPRLPGAVALGCASTTKKASACAPVRRVRGGMGHGARGHHQHHQGRTRMSRTATARKLKPAVAAAAAIALAIPALKKGETYVGAIAGPDGKGHHVILLAGDKEGLTWSAALEWAKAQGGDLPDRVEQALLFRDHRAAFKRDWYWSNTQTADDERWAWYQYFRHGTSTTTTRAASSELARSAECPFNHCAERTT
jgi:hypothetical protein